VKKCLLWFATLLFLATISAPTIANADLPPTCGPDGCSKPGLAVIVTADLPPTCGPDGCSKPGVQ
jgi:hypothetical protein